MLWVGMPRIRGHAWQGMWGHGTAKKRGWTGHDKCPSKHSVHGQHVTRMLCSLPCRVTIFGEAFAPGSTLVYINGTVCRVETERTTETEVGAWVSC